MMGKSPFFDGEPGSSTSIFSWTVFVSCSDRGATALISATWDTVLTNEAGW